MRAPRIFRRMYTYVRYRIAARLEVMYVRRTMQGPTDSDRVSRYMGMMLWPFGIAAGGVGTAWTRRRVEDGRDKREARREELRNRGRDK
jgi:hypothetical protein